MFAETKHLRHFFQKLSCIKTGLYYHISNEIFFQILSRGYCRTVSFIRPIAIDLSFEAVSK